MKTLAIVDLERETTLDAEAMEAVKGGLAATVNNPQAGNQTLGAGFGSLVAINMPISIPTTVLTEVKPVINVDLDFANLIASHQNAVAV